MADPKPPMTDPNLVRVLQRQTKTPVGLLSHETVRDGLDAMRAWSRAQIDNGTAFAIADAATPGDLKALAELNADWP